MNILVTGGAGYIGAHAVRELQNAGHSVIIIDNLSTGQRSNLTQNATLVEGDFADLELLQKVFNDNKIDAVMHFAASIDLNESIEKPLQYLENNTLKTGNLVQAMLEAGVTKLIFSSTAAVYGKQKAMPIPETAIGEDLAPYGLSKLLSEKLIHGYTQSTGLQAIVFRYFNATGSDEDKQIYPNHSTSLIPQVIDVAQGRKDFVTIYGTDFDTIDGSGVRDFVHVVDIARAHVAGLDHLEKGDLTENFKVYNVGTGTGWSVKQIIAATERITGKHISVQTAERRPVDVAIAVADNTKIRAELGFEPKLSDLDSLISSSIH